MKIIGIIKVQMDPGFIEHIILTGLAPQDTKQ